MQLAKGGYYAANMLFKTVSTDEDGKTSTEYKDKLGRVVMIRNSQNVDTYYVYNDLGQLMYVLPPIASDNINGSIGVGIISDGHTQLKIFGYIYKYDSRGNCIYKRLPGCEPILMVYDKADRLVLSQDGNQRGSHQWSFMEYDVLGRVVQSGTTTVVISNEAALNALRQSISTSLIRDIFDGTGYNSMSLGSNPIVLIENYYDNYEFINMSAYSSFSSRLSFSQVTGFDNQYIHPTTPAISARGMLTGTMVRMLDNSAIEVTAMYYDDRGRVVQSRTNNRLNGYDYDWYHYSFTGQVLNHRHIHKIPTVSTELIENYRFTYDHADRLISTFHKLNTRAEVKLSELVYDELGRVSQKILHSGGETIDYSYNIRNWTKSITSNRFSQTLYYQDALDGKPVYYNGNISAIKWGTGATQDKKYHFSYDGLNRMIEAIYSPDHLFDERITSYDKHGNILTMDRCGWIQEYNDEEPIQGDIDNLQMAYQGNQLISALDNIADWEERMNNDFYDVSDENQPIEYLYDANGNQYADLNKGIAWIKYNLLNLPEKIQFQNGNKIEYLYDALGVKRQAKWAYSTSTLNIPLGSTVQENNSLQGTTTTLYCGNYIYEQGQIKRLLTTEGYMTNGGYVPLILLSRWRYNYFLKDYQGNTRQTLYGNMLSGSQSVLFASDSSTIDYYPFGMQISNSDGTLTSGTNPYLYNGKEIDRMHGLNQYDYGARWRDGALPPWTTVDPLAEKYYNISPYAYCLNNPVLFVDPDGRKVYKFGFSYSMSSGIFGATVKLLGIGVGVTYSPGAAKQELSFYVSYNTENKKVGVGATHTKTIIESGNSVTVGPFKHSESNEKAEVLDANTTTGVTKTVDNTFTESESGGFGAIETIEKDGVVTSGVSVSGEINAGMVGFGAKIGLTIEPSPNATTTKNKKPETKPSSTPAPDASPFKQKESSWTPF